MIDEVGKATVCQGVTTSTSAGLDWEGEYEFLYGCSLTVRKVQRPGASLLECMEGLKRLKGRAAVEG